MRSLPAVILAVVLVAAEGKPLASGPLVETQQTATQPLQLSDHIEKAQKVIDNFGTQIQQQLNLPNQEEFLNTIKEQSTNLANNVQEYIKTMSEDVKAKSPELQNLWTNMKNKVSEAIDKLNVNPETTEQMNQLRAKFQEGVQTLVTESENAAKTISENSSKVQEGIAKFTKQAIDIAVQATENLNNQLQQTTTPASQL